MRVFLALLFLFSIAGMVIFLIKTIVSLFTKNNLGKNVLKFFGCFILLMLSVVLIVIVQEGKDNDSVSKPPQATNRSDDEFGSLGQVSDITPPPESTPSERIDKDRALKVDKAIWDRIVSAEGNYNNLLTAMENVSSPYSLFDFCEKLENLMVSYSSDVNRISDDLAGEYIQSAGLYFYQVEKIANHVKKYINNNDMNELSKAKDGMGMLAGFTSDVVAARFAYLSACGFSNDEIINVTESSMD